MKKRFLSLTLSLCMALSLCTPAFAANVVLSPQNLTVDGKAVTCEKYNIGGANYFKLRDLAQALSGTSSQFEVGWDGATGTVSITTGKAYTSVGGELSAGADKSSTAQVSKQTIQINGVTRSDLSAYNIGGANFFKLRDLGTALGFGVDFDSATNTATVKSGEFFAKEIAQFNSTVDRSTLSAAAQDTLKSDSHFSTLTANRLTVGGTPLYEVYQDDGAKKPLVILIHGGHASKDDTFRDACDLASSGLYAIAIDTAGCGESTVGPIDALKSWVVTVAQIDTLIEYYNTVAQADAAHFGITGYSMGGNIAFAYVGHGKYRPDIITPSLATPDYTTLPDGPLYDTFGWENQGTEPLMSKDEIRAFAAAYSPINQPARFLDVNIYAGNGMVDTITGPEGCMALEQALKGLGGTKFSFNYYEGKGHEGLPGYDSHHALQQVLLGRA